ncbi:hypothetical protein ACHAWC_000150, partial [Mediolabrus comicus]
VSAAGLRAGAGAGDTGDKGEDGRRSLYVKYGMPGMPGTVKGMPGSKGMSGMHYGMPGTVKGMPGALAIWEQTQSLVVGGMATTATAEQIQKRFLQWIQWMEH